MPDLKKTIQAMECCLNRNYFSKCPPACPYNGTEQDGACGTKVLNDALELLKAQTVPAVPLNKLCEWLANNALIISGAKANALFWKGIVLATGLLKEDEDG